jgi:hypothetical protein
MNRRGMLIIEFLIYLMLFSFMAMISASWVSYVWKHYIHQSHQRHALITLYVSHDVLLRDIHAIKKVVSCTPEYLVAQVDQDYVGWIKHNDQLLRLKGSYNETTQQWIARSKNLMAQPLDKLAFSEHADGITFTLSACGVIVTNRVNFDREVLYNVMQK